MGKDTFFIRLDQLQSSYLVLLSLAGIGITAGILFYSGLLGWILSVIGRVIRASVWEGFRLWERLFAWASWPVFLAIVFGSLIVGWAATGHLPGLTVVCALAPLFMGATACLAYMFIDLERYEVERGYKAIHNPLKGQELALHLVRYGQQVGVPLLVAATVGMIGGFALLNQGLYETVGRDWYTVGGDQEGPRYVDFLAYALINLLRIVDVLNVASSHHFLGVAYVGQAAWPASTLSAVFRMFFTLVLLQQIFASLRQGRLLSETITDLWNPHQPIYERARNALPQYGPAAIGPLLVSLRSVTSLTKEQRDQLPPILAAIGPAIIPALVRHLHDAHAHVRAIAAATLGHLHVRDTVPLLIQLDQDSSDIVRQSLVEALGLIGGAGAHSIAKRRGRGLAQRSQGRGLWRLFGRKRPLALIRQRDPIELAVATLQASLTDTSVSVRTQAAKALAWIGPPATAAAPSLIALLKDGDESVRLAAAEALGKVGGATEATVNALIELLQDANPAVKAAAARALGALKKLAASAFTALVSLLQDREETVRTAVAEAIGQIGRLNEEATDNLVLGLASPDNMVRAQTAEALGTIGTPAQETAGALVEAVADRNDVVRARAVEALGKIGEGAAGVAVPSLVRALRDQDNWVSSLAAEALGQMGESANGAIPALIRSLRHINPLVRANAAEALGKMGMAAAGSPPALEKACQDEDAGVRGQAMRALSMIGLPTTASRQAVLAGLQDADPQVRAAAVEAVGQWGGPSEAVLGELAALLEDANDLVKIAVTKVLPKLAGATPAVIDGLCRRLLEDASVDVQVHAVLALGNLGPAAAAAGGPLLRVTQTGEVRVREQAMRAIAVIQPVEGITALAAGLKDADGEIRKVASGGLMNVTLIPPEVVPGLLDALRDPEIQVRANAAHVLGRLQPLPGDAIAPLVECAAGPDDGLRLNAALALRSQPPDVVSAVFQQLLGDVNPRLRLIATAYLLDADATHAQAGAVLLKALTDPATRFRKAALELIATLGLRGAVFLDALKQRSEQELDPSLSDLLAQVIENLEHLTPTDELPVCQSSTDSR